jgi:hypothetical protein
LMASFRNALFFPAIILYPCRIARSGVSWTLWNTVSPI